MGEGWGGVGGVRPGGYEVLNPVMQLQVTMAEWLSSTQSGQETYCLIITVPSTDI